MSEQDGLFENPNKTGNELEQKRTDTLQEIKRDTSSILDVLQQFDGAAVERVAQVERAEKNARKQTAQGQTAIERAIALNTKTVDVARQAQAKQHKETLRETKKAKRNASSSKDKKVTATAKTPLSPRGRKNGAQTPSDVARDALFNPLKNEKKARKSKAKNKAKSENLPNGWTRDKDGRVRDTSGKYVSEKELKKHNISNSSHNKEDTEQEARQRRMLDVLGGIQDAVSNTENLDPVIEGFREISAPLGVVKNVAGRGFDKLFNRDKKDERQRNRWRDRFFAFFKKSEKNSEKNQSRVLNWLKAIYKKPTDGKGGLFSRLFGGIGRFLWSLIRSPKALLSLLGGGLLRLFKGGFGLLGKGFSGLFKGGKGLLGGLFGGIGKLGKGLFRKIPIIGSLLAIADGIGGLFDNSRDEDGKSNRGKRVGGSIGTLIGGALGSFVGPIGTIVGAMIGDWIGTKLGAWIADFNWSDMGKKIKGVWNSTLSWVSSTWNKINWGSIGGKVLGFLSGAFGLAVSAWNAIDWGSIGASIKNAWNGAKDWIKSTWDSLDFGAFGEQVKAIWTPVATWIGEQWNKIDWGGIGESIKSGWNSALDWITETWNKIDWSATWDKTKEIAANLWDGATNLVKNAKDKAVEWGTSAVNYTKDTASSAWGTVKDSGRWVANQASSTASGLSEILTKNTTRQLEENGEYLKTQLERQAESNTLLDQIKNILADTLLLWRDWVSGGGATETINGHPDDIAKFSSAGAVPFITGSGVDPKTGQKIKYTQGTFYGGAIEGLTPEQTAAVANALSMKESGGDPTKMNTLGFTGLYQFGAETLATLGLVDNKAYQAAIKPYQRKNKKGKTYLDQSWWNGAHEAFLMNNANWKLPGGIEAFRNNKELQDKTWITMTNRNLAYLKREGVKFKSAEDVAAAAFASNLAPVYTKNWILKGEDHADGYGTKVSYYHALGRNTIQGVGNSPTNTATVGTPTATVTPQLAQMAQPVGNVAQANLTIPPVNIAQMDVSAIRQKVEEEKPKTQPTPPLRNESAPVQTASAVDPVIALLTQDVSDRRIAHIVTGGIARMPYH